MTEEVTEEAKAPAKKSYVKYQHVEKLGSDSVDGLLMGDVYVFPKIDGTNAHAWFDGERMRYGSRRNELSLDADNAGFMRDMLDHKGLTALCMANPNVHVFGEWLVPHSLKTYRKDAWREFYVFDLVMVSEETEHAKHWHYECMSEECYHYGVKYIPVLRTVKFPTIEDLYKTLAGNNYLIEDGKGSGEGIVLKNYEFVNKYGRQIWGKLVTSEFQEKNRKKMGAPAAQGTTMVESSMVNEYITKALVDKTYHKVVLDRKGWSNKCIPELLNRVYHDLVVEHMWDATKKWKRLKVDFNRLQQFCNIKVKEFKPELF